MTSPYSSTSDFFKNQTVFVTGATGLVGKLVVEKLLRTCDVKRIYLLMRTKHGQKPEERFQDFFSNACFDLITNQSVKEKVHVIGGDCSKPFFGLSPEHVTVLKEETTCFIHTAADVSFDKNLHEASNTVRGAMEMLALAKLMLHLKVLVYVSTAYCNCICHHSKEEFYPPRLKAQTFLDLVNNIDEKSLENMTPFLLGKWPNTYVYTKSISEDAIKDAHLDVPVVIIRPTVITTTISEPIRGWIENANAYIGIVCLVCLGIVRSIHIALDKRIYIVPADYVCNSILAAAAKVEKGNSEGPIIYHILGTSVNLGRVLKTSFSFYWEFPSVKYLWYFSNKLIENKFVHRAHYYYGLLVAYLIDAILFCLRKQSIVVQKYKRLNYKANLMMWFSVREWVFDDSRANDLWNQMSEDDKRTFDFNSKISDWEEYLRDCAIGARKFIFKDPLETLPVAKRRLKMLFAVHYTLIILWCYCLCKVFLFVMNKV